VGWILPGFPHVTPGFPLFRVAEHHVQPPGEHPGADFFLLDQ